MELNAKRNSTTRNPSRIALSYTAAIGALYFNIQPVLLGSFVESFALNEQQVGGLSAIGLLSAFVGLGSSYFWVRKVNWQRIIAFGILVNLFATIVLYLATGYIGVAFSSVLLGAGMALIYAPVLVALGFTPNPVKSFGIAITGMVLLAGATVLFVPIFIVPQWGSDGFAGFLFFVFAVGLAFVRGLPIGAPNITSETSTTNTQSKHPKLAALCLAATAVYFIGINANWSFFEIIGEFFRLSEQDISYALASSLAFGGLGSAVAALINRRISIPVALTVSALGLLVYALLMMLWPNIIGFAFGVVIFNIAWNFSLPFQMEAVAACDESGRFVALIPAGQMIGGALGAGVAGFLFMAPGVTALYLLLILSSAIAFVIFAWVNRKLQRSLSVGLTTD